MRHLNTCLKPTVALGHGGCFGGGLGMMAACDVFLFPSLRDGGGTVVIEAMARGMGRNEVFPVFCGAAPKTYGMRALLKKIVELCPSPAEAGAEVVGDTELVASDSGPLAACPGTIPRNNPFSVSWPSTLSRCARR